jgi:hypothetical protein
LKEGRKRKNWRKGQKIERRKEGISGGRGEVRSEKKRGRYW